MVIVTILFLGMATTAKTAHKLQLQGHAMPYWPPRKLLAFQRLFPALCPIPDQAAAKEIGKEIAGGSPVTVLTDADKKAPTDSYSSVRADSAKKVVPLKVLIERIKGERITTLADLKAAIDEATEALGVESDLKSIRTLKGKANRIAEELGLDVRA